LLYAVTHADAPHGRVCSVDPTDPRRQAWSTLVTPEHDALLMACTALTDPDSGQLRLLVGTTRDGWAHLAVPGPSRWSVWTRSR
jgi:prolyl oligopeptidase